MQSDDHYLTVTSSMKETNTLDDAELVIAAKAGSNEAFELLQSRYYQRLYRKILSITRNREDAEDALQDTLLHAYVSLASFEGRSRFSSWLTQIAINSALMILRKRRRRGDVNVGQKSESDCNLSFLDLADSRLNPEQTCDQQQRCVDLFRAVQNLNPKFAAAIRIKANRECSIEEMAHTLNISVSAAKTRLQRGRLRLRRSLERTYGKRWPNLNRMNFAADGFAALCDLTIAQSRSFSKPANEAENH